MCKYRRVFSTPPLHPFVLVTIGVLSFTLRLQLLLSSLMLPRPCVPSARLVACDAARNVHACFVIFYYIFYSIDIFFKKYVYYILKIYI